MSGVYLYTKKGGDRVADAMERTQIYLPKSLKAWIKKQALWRGVSMADEIRSRLNEQKEREERKAKREGTK